MRYRFKYYPKSNYIVDALTGFVYQGNQDTCDLLNKINHRADDNASEVYQYMMVMKKYEIESIEKLDKILMEQRVW